MKPATNEDVKRLLTALRSYTLWSSRPEHGDFFRKATETLDEFGIQSWIPPYLMAKWVEAEKFTTIKANVSNVTSEVVELISKMLDEQEAPVQQTVEFVTWDYSLATTGRQHPTYGDYLDDLDTRRYLE